MRIRAVAAVGVALTACLTTATGSAAGGPCRHLLVDPRGDVDDTSGLVVNTQQVDIVSADLRSTPREVIATLEVDDLPEEAGTEVFDFSYSVDFSSNGERFLLTFGGGKPHPYASAWHVIAGSDQPEQEDGAGAQAAEGVGEATSFTVDRRRDTVTLRFARAIFSEYGGIGRTLSKISASAWWGNGVRPTPEGGYAGSYASSDFGYTKTSYRDGAPSCG